MHHVALPQGLLSGDPLAVDVGAIAAAIDQHMARHSPPQLGIDTRDHGMIQAHLVALIAADGEHGKLRQIELAQMDRRGGRQRLGPQSEGDTHRVALLIADAEDVAVAQAICSSLGEPIAVERSAVGAAQIDQPVLSATLFDANVSARDRGVRHENTVRRLLAPNGRRKLDQRLLAGRGLVPE